MASTSALVIVALTPAFAQLNALSAPLDGRPDREWSPHRRVEDVCMELPPNVAARVGI